MPQTVRIHLAATQAPGCRRGWFKHVSSINPARMDGYAFVGEWLRDGPHDLPIGSVIVEQRPQTLVSHNHRKPLAAYLVCAGDHPLKKCAKTHDWHADFLSFRATVAALCASATTQSVPEIPSDTVAVPRQLLCTLRSALTGDTDIDIIRCAAQRVVDCFPDCGSTEE